MLYSAAIKMFVAIPQVSNKLPSYRHINISSRLRFHRNMVEQNGLDDIGD
jgi:hypothetical protein